jgi:hypothetical protein
MYLINARSYWEGLSIVTSKYIVLNAKEATPLGLPLLL